MGKFENKPVTMPETIQVDWTHAELAVSALIDQHEAMLEKLQKQLKPYSPEWERLREESRAVGRAIEVMQDALEVTD